MGRWKVGTSPTVEVVTVRGVAPGEERAARGVAPGGVPPQPQRSWGRWKGERLQGVTIGHGGNRSASAYTLWII